MWKLHSLDPSFVIKIADSLLLSDDLRAQVDAIWVAALAERPNLFDGSIVTVVDLSGHQLVLGRASYRHMFAARSDPGLRRALGLRPLAVSGILSCADGLVFGRRAQNVTQRPGLWELVPSGGVEAPADGSVPDLGAQILRELREEIGLTADHVTLQAPVGAIEDATSGVVDVVMPLDTRLSASEVKAVHTAKGTREYERLHITRSPHTFAESRDDLLEETRIILDAFVRA